MTESRETDGSEALARYDSETIRCKRLGHDVSFKYCRMLEGKTVCRSIRDCWWTRLPVDEVLHGLLTDEEFAALAAPRPKPPKLVDLIRLAQEAKKRREETE